MSVWVFILELSMVFGVMNVGELGMVTVFVSC